MSRLSSQMTSAFKSLLRLLSWWANVLICQTMHRSSGERCWRSSHPCSQGSSHYRPSWGASARGSQPL